ncbi:2-amino-4-hydroxy-6-hydroxymethyldihydropteridine diphosphokinase, partial [Mycobacterium tuberculosis]|nr:2-amino-4-hydroxy-6-hydroxymethyldihydropteridine diphosphokinase [Mycobacterium tuberculosis]
ACACVETSLEPEALLAATLDIERRLKRERIERWGPRIIDIDLLVYEGREHFESPTLTLPHPRMTERAFVLVPLGDIAPDLVVGGKSIAGWAL